MTSNKYEPLANELGEIVSVLLEATETVLANTKQSRASLASEVERAIRSMSPAETGAVLNNMVVELQNHLPETGKSGVAFNVKPTGFSVAGHQMIGIAVTDGNTTVSVGGEPSDGLSGIEGGGLQIEHRY